MAKQEYYEDEDPEESDSFSAALFSKHYEGGSDLQLLLSDVTSMLQKIEPFITGTYHPTMAAIKEREKLQRSSDILLELIEEKCEAIPDEEKMELDLLAKEIGRLDRERIEQYKQVSSASPVSMPGNFVVVPNGWDDERAKQ